jgi:hypothetical protein
MFCILPTHLHTEPGTVPHGLYMLKKNLPSLWLVHKHFPCAVAALLHHRLKWLIPNISNTPTKESPSDWGPVSMRAMEWAHPNLSTFHESLDRCCLTWMRKWTRAPLYMNHMWFCIDRGTSSMGCGRKFTKKLWYATLVSLLGKTCQSPIISACTLIRNHCWCLNCRIAWDEYCGS